MATERRRLHRRAAALVLALAALGWPTAGFAVPVTPPGGLLFTWVKAPADTNFSATPIGSKMGTAETRYLYIPLSTYVPLSFAFGDAAVKRAADDAGITTVHFIDYEYLNVLGIYQQLTIRVFGD